jgi:hypothetical protein
MKPGTWGRFEVAMAKSRGDSFWERSHEGSVVAIAGHPVISQYLLTQTKATIRWRRHFGDVHPLWVVHQAAEWTAICSVAEQVVLLEPALAEE